MRKWLRDHFSRQLIRPIIYRVFSRLAYTLIVVLIFTRFFDRSARGLSTAFALMGVIFLLGTLIANLRQDGLRFPRLPARIFKRKNKPTIFYGDMSDHVDDSVVSFEELEADEQDTCLIFANLICAALYITASLLN